MSYIEAGVETAGTQSVPASLRCIYFYFGGCNLRCRHCWINAGYQPGDRTYRYALDFQLFRSIISQAKPLGLTSVKLTGGEPLMHPETHDVLRLVRDEGLELNLETNGTLVTSEIADLIRTCRNPFVSVSIDGADAQTHEWVRGVPGCFEQALEGVRILVDAGFSPQIIMSILTCNKNQIEAVVRLAEQLGAGSVKFNLVSNVSRGAALESEGGVPTLEDYLDIGRWVETELRHSSSVTLMYSHPDAFVPLGNMFGGNTSRCGSCGITGIIGVLADGSYAMCGIGETIKDLVFGNAAENPLMEVWATNPILLEIRQKFPHGIKGICAKCVMRHACKGYCIALNYLENGDLWSGYRYCEEAYRKGLFPASRLVPDVSNKEVI